MSTGNKPMTPQERIKADAEAYANNEYSAYASNINDIAHSVWKSCVTTYIAGATAEHGRAQVLVDALDNAKNHIHELCMTIIRLGYTPFNPISEINEALEQWKGKEVKPVKEIEYMPIHPEDAKKFDCPTQFPMHLLDEGQAFSNHGQSLVRLKERGGLSVREILAIVGKKPWSYYGSLPWDEAIKMLYDIVITNPQK